MVVQSDLEPIANTRITEGGLTMANSEFESEVTWERVLPVWWAFMWRGSLYGMLLGFFLGFCGGLIVGFAGRPDLGAPVGALLGWLGTIPVTLVVMSIVLKKRFGTFSIKLVPHGGAG